MQISFDFLLAFQFLRNDRTTQISQSTLWRNILGAVTCTRARSSSVSNKQIYLSSVFYHALLFERPKIIDSKRRSENLCHESLKMKYEKTTRATRPLPHPPPLRTKAKLRYCHVRHGSVLSLCVLPKLLWFAVGKTRQGKD